MILSWDTILGKGEAREVVTKSESSERTIILKDSSNNLDDDY